MTITRSSHSLFVLVGLLLASCETTTTPVNDYTPRTVVEIEKWRVEAGGQLLGFVHKLEIRDPSGPVHFFRITDEAGRWVGHASDNYRFSRRVPFQEEEQDLGVYSRNRGVAMLLEASTPVQLKPIPVEADFRPEVKKQR